jgi:hypothetical protein
VTRNGKGATQPTPRQKLPKISPIFKADTVRPHVLREKDREIALGRCRMGRYEGRFLDAFDEAGIAMPFRQTDAMPQNMDWLREAVAEYVSGSKGIGSGNGKAPAGRRR